VNNLREQYHVLQQRLFDLQDVVEIRGLPSSSRHEGKVAARDEGDFDPLELDEYNELHSKNTALAEAVTDFCELALGLKPELAKMEDTVADQQRISKEFSDSVLSARMVLVGQVEPRLQRAVRETCRATGKQATLTVSGGGIPVDGDVLNALMDPLLHVLRNAVDHGIETREVRESAGKDPAGALEVRFSREGENVLVEVCDDGAGFDIDSIREVAQHRGMLTGR
jgi:chemotaxis protein histidine kinase CheA